MTAGEALEAAGEPGEGLELSYDKAVALLPDGDTVHTWTGGGITILGADWPRAAVLELLRSSPRLAVAGPRARSFGHGLSVHREDGGPVLVETRQEARDG